MSRIFDNIILFLNTYRIIYVKCARFQKIKKLLEKCNIKSLISFKTKDKLNKYVENLTSFQILWYIFHESVKSIMTLT